MWLETAGSWSIWRPDLFGVVFLVVMFRVLYFLWSAKLTNAERNNRKAWKDYNKNR